MADSNSMPCHLCGHAEVEPVPEYAALRRVTSDCKPWAAHGWLGVCRACGGVQKRMDATWRAEIERIYHDYSIYHQSGGTEQPVFAAATGLGRARSERIVERLVKSGLVRESGRLLDVGCGNGALLRACSRLLPGWSLAGTEINDKYKTEVEHISGVSVMQVGGATDVPGEFDFVTLVHVLEHVPSPSEFLASLKAKLVCGGNLMVEVPHYVDNPFDLLIVDHSTHFSVEVLRGVAERGGFAAHVLVTDWVAKELTLVAQPSDATNKVSSQSDQIFSNARAEVHQRVGWLASMARQARELSQAGPFGLFGTSIAATWLFGELAGRVDFFVDEDPTRVGRTCFGKPILSPQKAPAGTRIWIPLPTKIGEQIKARLTSQYSNLEFHLPPELA